jgi:hypothetical protein
MKFTKALLAIAAALLCAAGNANAQTVQMVGAGSSALFLELGQAAYHEPSIGANCTWTTKYGSANLNAPYLTDTRVSPGAVDDGNTWIAWQQGTGTCAAPAGAYNIYAYVSVDSTVGNRCLLANPACTLSVPVANTSVTGSNLLAPFPSTDSALPAAVANALNGTQVNVAGTDIRPEDAKFATIRALTDCGVPVNGAVNGAPGSQYLGLGYATASGAHTGVQIIQSAEAQGTALAFNVLDFNLIGDDPISGGGNNSSYPVPSFSVYDIGAVPIVVFVNPGDESGLGSLQITNVNRGTLAGFLDGTLGRSVDLIPEGYSGSSGVATTVFIREPLSGTYNTMEYAIPNNIEFQTSQDVAYNTASSDPDMPNCTTVGAGGQVSDNPMEAAKTKRVIGSTTEHSWRYRAIGTGNMVKSVELTADSLGYAFWGSGNFSSATASNAKYLTVDGVDPIQEAFTDGLFPTSGNGLLGNVSLSNVRNGSYPIWSKLRIVGSAGQGAAMASLFSSVIQNYVGPTQPDFIPISQLLVVRSHFAPPAPSSGYNVNFPSSGTNLPSNGTTGCGGPVEAGGDVGGVVYSQQTDADFCKDQAATANPHPTNGQTGRRQ